MTKKKKNMGSGATIFLALVAAGVITIGKSAKQQIDLTPLIVVAIVVLFIYTYKIKIRR